MEQQSFQAGSYDHACMIKQNLRKNDRVNAVFCKIYAAWIRGMINEGKFCEREAELASYDARRKWENIAQANTSFFVLICEQ